MNYTISQTVSGDTIAESVTQPSISVALYALIGGGGGGGAVSSVNGQVGVVVLTKSDIGLGSVDNTADASKPVSTAQAAADAAVQAYTIQRANHTGTQAWSTITGVPSTFTPSAHAGTHAAAGSDPITISESQVTGLVADLAAKAPLASPTFTGAPAAPTAAANDNTTKIATTAWVIGQASATTPVVDGVAAIGTSLTWARADHVHPTDTTRAAAARTLTAGTGLSGGGDLSADRTFTVTYGTTVGTSCQGNDSRLSDSRTPTSHASTHNLGGSDVIAPSSSQVATALITDATTARTVSDSDHGSVIRFTSSSAVTVTFPNTLRADFTCVLLRDGTGTVAWTGSSATIRNGSAHTQIAHQYGSATVFKVATGEFRVQGDTA